ncbi:unannotated protein [freshwater metagenome]|uniref:Unannotated protein n=1 Tax=freshwater metagenome TaxID=449393 RepID=A0A6J7JRU5_9ZZZZ
MVSNGPMASETSTMSMLSHRQLVSSPASTTAALQPATPETVSANHPRLAPSMRPATKVTATIAGRPRKIQANSAGKFMMAVLSGSVLLVS